MDTNTEPTDLKKADKDFAPEQIEKLQTPGVEDVDGHSMMVLYRRCPTCGAIGTRSTGAKYAAYQCTNCGAVLVEA